MGREISGNAILFSVVDMGGGSQRILYYQSFYLFLPLGELGGGIVVGLGVKGYRWLCQGERVGAGGNGGNGTPCARAWP